jgi:hypothetical protein
MYGSFTHWLSHLLGYSGTYISFNFINSSFLLRSRQYAFSELDFWESFEAERGRNAYVSEDSRWTKEQYAFSSILKGDSRVEPRRKAYVCDEVCERSERKGGGGYLRVSAQCQGVPFLLVVLMKDYINRHIVCLRLFVAS